MDEYFSYLLVKKEESLFLNDSEKNNLIKRICFEILIANNRFISNDISQSFVNFINSKENQFSFEDVIDEYMSVDKISLDGFLLINKVYDITDLMIDDIDRIKDINLKEKLLKFKLIKDEKKVLDSFIIKENEEEKIVIKRL